MLKDFKFIEKGFVFLYMTSSLEFSQKLRKWQKSPKFERKKKLLKDVKMFFRMNKIKQTSEMDLISMMICSI